MGGKAYIKLKAIERWDGKLPAYYGGSGQMPLLKLDSVTK